MMILNQYLYALIVFGAIISFSCNNSPRKAINHQGNQIPIDTSDCFPDRKSQDTIIIDLGTVTQLSDQFYITASENNRRFIACNMPQECKSADIKVRCQLVVKEIFPYERRAGTPALLQSISIVEP